MVLPMNFQSRQAVASETLADCLWRVEPRLDHQVSVQLVQEFFETPFPYAAPLAAREYGEKKRALQFEMVKLQASIKATGRRLVILFEGRDAAGKGGTIKRFIEHLNPRGARVVALDKPSEVERGQWYFQRYIEQLPTAGEIVLFDRSWYNRAGVERVMGFCTEEDYRSFLRQAVELERHLHESGTILVKFWLSVSQEEQKVRFERRARDPLKSWKLSPIDLASAERYAEYSQAERDVFAHTATAQNPWVVIKSDCKRRARLAAMSLVLERIDYEGKQPANLLPRDSLLLAEIATKAAARSETLPSRAA